MGNSNLSAKGGFVKIHLFYFLIKSVPYNFKIACTKVYKKRMRFFQCGRYIAYINTKLLRERGSLRTRRRSNKPGNSQAKGL